MHGYEDIVCRICNFSQPLQNRQDVVAMQGSNGHQMQPQAAGGNGNVPQGWNNQPKPQPGPTYG